MALLVTDSRPLCTQVHFQDDKNMDSDPEMIIRLANSLKDLLSVCKVDTILSCPASTRHQGPRNEGEGPARTPPPPPQARQFDIRGCGANDLNFVEREELFSMFEVSMKEQYLKNWGWNPMEKRNELFHPMSRFLCLYEREEEAEAEAEAEAEVSTIPADADIAVEKEKENIDVAGGSTVFQSTAAIAASGSNSTSTNRRRKCVAYTMFRFEWDDEDEPEYPVCYCYELQVSPSVQGCGIGKHLMKSLVKISNKLHLWKVLLTCFVSNESAMNFYKSADVGFGVDVNSPHKADYEILSDKPTLR